MPGRSGRAVARGRLRLLGSHVGPGEIGPAEPASVPHASM